MILSTARRRRRRFACKEPHRLKIFFAEVYQSMNQLDTCPKVDNVFGHALF